MSKVCSTKLYARGVISSFQDKVYIIGHVPQIIETEGFIKELFLIILKYI